MTERRPFQSVLESHPEHVNALGMVSIELANLELFMGHLLGALIGIDPHLAEIIYLTPKTGFGRIEVLENVVTHVLVDGSQGQNHLLRLLARAKAIMQKRHGLVHVVWVETQPDNSKYSEVYRMPVPIKEPAKSVHTPLEFLTDLVRDIRVLVADVQSETNRLSQQRIADAIAREQAASSQPKPSEPPEP